MVRFETLLKLALILLIPATATAAGLQEQRRADFTAAREALSADDLAQYRRLAAGLEDYILYPYLRYDELRRRLHRAAPEEVRAFLEANAATPLAPRLRREWLEQLARSGRWALFLDEYRDGMGTELACRRAGALLRAGRLDELWPLVDELWMAGESQPKACDPAFAAWREAKRMTADKVERRIDLALARDEYRLARYLARFLPKQASERVERRIRVQQHPGRELAGLRRFAGEPWAAQAFAEGLRRLAAVDAKRAAALLASDGERHRLDEKATAAVTRAVGLQLAFDRDPQAVAYLSAGPADPADHSRAEWRVRAALRAQDWPQVLAAVEALPASLAGESEWRYWKARALEQLGEDARATAAFQELAGCRCFFGFVAAARLGLEPALDNKPVAVRVADIAALASRPGLARAAELYRVEMTLEARREWYAALRGLSPAQLEAAARLADGLGWHDQAILTLARAGSFEDLELRFPLAYREQVFAAAARHTLDPALIYGVIRQESAFHPSARSRAGAMGLMQLMPATARRTAKQLEQRIGALSEVYEVGRNVHLGSAYLAALLERYENNLLYALAAYNAGPANVERWRPQEQSLPADVWLSTITYKETRHYVQRVIAYTLIYRWRLGHAPLELALDAPLLPADAERRAARSRGREPTS